MTIQIGNYTFEGDFKSTGELLDRSGVYVVLGATNEFGGRKVLDVGESGAVRSRVQSHDRAVSWSTHWLPLSVAALYCDEQARIRIERELRAQFDPPCGDR